MDKSGSEGWKYHRRVQRQTVLAQLVLIVMIIFVVAAATATGRFIANWSIRTLTTDLTLIISSSRPSTTAAAGTIFYWYV